MSTSYHPGSNAGSSLEFPATVVQMPVEQMANLYNMNHPNRGKALIFNHENFEMGHFKLPSRPASKYDCDALVGCLSDWGFEVHPYTDKCYDDIMNTVKDVAYENHTNNDCILIAILTHGRLGILAAKDREYNFEEIWSKFTADVCPSLAGKPKIFIIQACRGENVLSSVTLSSRVEHDGGGVSYKIPTHADFLFAYSTIPDYFAFIRENSGSWFIQALCDEIRLSKNSYDLVTLLTFVSRHVAIYYESSNPMEKKIHGKKQLPCIMSMLTRLIVFNKKA